MNVLFIGADSSVAEVVHIAVLARWPDVAFFAASTGSEGLAVWRQKKFDKSDDVIIVHGLAGLSLREVLREIRKVSGVMAMVLAHRGEAVEAITAFVMGANEYVRHPFTSTELTARIKARLRRIDIDRRASENECPLRSGDLVINPATHEAFLGDGNLELSRAEFRLLYLLMKNAERCVLHREIEDALVGEGNGTGLTKRYVGRIRRKLGDDARKPEWITAVWGLGYRFTRPVHCQ